MDGVINILIMSLNEIVVRARRLKGSEHSPNSIDVSVSSEKKQPLIKLLYDSINVIRQSEELPIYGVAYHNLIAKLIVEQK